MPRRGRCRLHPGRWSRRGWRRSHPAWSRRRRAAVVGRVEGARGRREVGRARVPGHVGVARASTAMAEPCRGRCRPGRWSRRGWRRSIEFVTKASAAAVEVVSKAPAVVGKSSGVLPGQVGAAGAVHCDAVALVAAASAQVGGVDEGGAAGVELCHEGVERRRVGRVEGAGGRREVAEEVSPSRRRCRRCRPRSPLP